VENDEILCKNREMTCC